MSTLPSESGKSTLERIARRVMNEHGFLADFSTDALDELEKILRIDPEAEAPGKDLRHLLWAPIGRKQR